MNVKLNISLYKVWRQDFDYCMNAVARQLRAGKKLMRDFESPEVQALRCDKDSTPKDAAKAMALLKEDYSKAESLSNLFEKQFANRSEDGKYVLIDWFAYDEIHQLFAIAVARDFRHEPRVAGAVMSFLCELEFELNNAYFLGLRDGTYIADKDRLSSELLQLRKKSVEFTEQLLDPYMMALRAQHEREKKQQGRHTAKKNSKKGKKKH